MIDNTNDLKTYTVEKLDGSGNPTIQSLHEWHQTLDEQTRSVIPEDSPLWQAPAWFITGDPIPGGNVLVTTPEQAAAWASLNTMLASVGGPTFACWGPTDLEKYVGQAVLDPRQQARLIVAITGQALSALEAGVAAGKRAVADRLQALETMSACGIASLLNLVLAREMYGRSLLTCGPQELSEIWHAQGRLLAATAVANASPLAADDLPKVPEWQGPVSRPVEPGPGTGMYL